MIDAYVKERKPVNALEVKLADYAKEIEAINQRIEYIRTNAGADLQEVSIKLKEHKYTRKTPILVSITSTSHSRKARSNSSPNIKGKQKASQESISYPDDDALPIGKRLPQIIYQLQIDEWKSVKPGASTEAVEIRESKMEKLDILLRILKNTTDIGVYCPKRNLVAWVMGLRTLRHLVEEPADVELMMRMQIDVFIVRALARESENHEPEREQTLKLVRSFIEYDGVMHISQNIVRAVVAIAEQADCRLRNVSLETLAELTILDVGRTVKSGGLRVLVQALHDGLLNMSDVLVQALIYVLDTPDRRCYLRPGVELEMIIAPFTEASKGPNYEQRLKNSAKMHTVYIDPATGADSGKGTFRSGTIPTSDTSGEAALPGATLDSDMRNNMRSSSTTAVNSERLKLLDHHLSIILIIFIESDILMALIDMVKSDDVYISRKATLLIGEILQLSTRLLPILMSIQVQSMPKLFALASNFEDEQVRHNATAALAHIDKLTRTRARYSSPATSNNKGGRLANANRTQEKVHEVKLKIGYAIDDTHFRQLLMDSQVLNTKDHAKWSWENIIELLQGPLLNPRRLDEAMRGRKFIKRLLAFYRPCKHQFCDIKTTTANVARYVKIGCTLISTLLVIPDGVRYLGENKLLEEVADALRELVPLSGGSETEPIFSKERMETTLSSGYLTLLGTFSKHKEGVRMMEKFKIFSLFYQLSELRNRDDLKVAIITNMDYTLDGHPRVLLSKIMTSGYNPIRLFATQYLGVIMRQSECEYNDWIIRLLVTQLYDTHLDVCQMAVSLLDEACEKQANLELLVNCRPSLGHLGEIGNPLLLRFLSTSTGFRYLNALGYVQKEMDDWFRYRNQQYVTQLELSLARALVNTPEKKSFDPFGDRVDSMNDFESLQPGDGLTPPHFFGELTKTEEGCNLLRESRHFQNLANYIRNYSVEHQDTEVLQQLKAVLWALGNIGATKNGLPFLEEEDIVKDIVFLAENSEVLSLKGTCFYVLGLIAKTRQGVELLGELGWEGVVSPNGVSEGLCVPLNLRHFLTIRNWNYIPTLSDPPLFPKSATSDAIAAGILKNIGNMSSHVTANEASRNLAKVRQRFPEYFRRVDLYYSVCQLLGSYHFRLPVRKYVLEIFDMRFTPELLHELDTISASVETHEIHRVIMTGNEEKEENSIRERLDPYDAIVPQEKLEPKCVKIGFHVQ
ncbi:hypothetical protein DFQ28_009870 [Apophysomyces sp. BC1034]|nr:hypothetical protein DFQ30_009430 [Apophysomyces sp. BC1015]KAG0192197.1 hypothetical protein DFQ28_009870 [Apophysomyces sp. BC1034]